MDTTDDFAFANESSYYPINVAPQAVRQDRGGQKTLFQLLETTKENAETYYISQIRTQANVFYLSLANHIVQSGTLKGFLTQEFIHACGQPSEFVAVWALLDLPYQFFEYNNQYSDTKIKEFLTNSVYGCEIIITNVSSKKQDFRILWQIPQGALPLQGANYQRSDNKELNGYSTTTFTFYFYFPYEGTFKQFPSNITIGDKVVSISNKCELVVVQQRREVSFETFRDILASGDNGAILNFLNTANLQKAEKGFNFSDLLWLLKDQKIFKQITDVL